MTKVSDKLSVMNKCGRFYLFNPTILKRNVYEFESVTSPYLNLTHGSNLFVRSSPYVSIGPLRCNVGNAKIKIMARGRAIKCALDLRAERNDHFIRPLC